MRTVLFLFSFFFASNCCLGQPLGNNNKNFNLKDCGNISKEDTIFTNVHELASYPGGEKEWQKFLRKHLDGTVAPDNGAKEGVYEIVVRFVVNRDGSVCSIRPETNFGHGMEQEVMRVVKKSKKWNPALINGVPVISYRRLPVTYDVVVL